MNDKEEILPCNADACFPNKCHVIIIIMQAKLMLICVSVLCSCAVFQPKINHILRTKNL